MVYKSEAQQRRHLTFEQQGYQRLEDEAVKTLVTAMKLPIRDFEAIKQIAKARSQDGSGLMLLSDFYEHVPEFPLDLVCAPNENLRANASLGQVFCLSNFTQYKFYRELIESRKSSNSRKSPIGVLIRWPYMVDLMCLHTAAINTTAPYSYMCVRVSDNLPAMRLEPLKQLIKAIYNDGEK
jgi:hypothetical protein